MHFWNHAFQNFLSFSTGSLFSAKNAFKNFPETVPFSKILNIWNISITVCFSEFDTLLMRYGVKFSSYPIKSVSNSLDQTVDQNLVSRKSYLVILASVDQLRWLKNQTFSGRLKQQKVLEVCYDSKVEMIKKIQTFSEWQWFSTMSWWKRSKMFIRFSW